MNEHRSVSQAVDPAARPPAAGRAESRDIRGRWVRWPAIAIALLASPAALRAQTAWEELQAQAAEAGSGAGAEGLRPPRVTPSAAATVNVDGDDRRWRSCAGDRQYAEVARRLGLGPGCLARTDHIGKVQNATSKVTFRDGAREVSVVRKRYGINLGTLKWRLEAMHYPFREVPLAPAKMFENQLRMEAAFREAGLKTAEIVAAFPENHAIYSRFVPAEGMEKTVARALAGDPASLALVEAYGGELVKAHRRGLSGGDLGPWNVLTAGGNFYFFDLDQGSIHGPCSWDIAKFLFDMSLPWMAKEFRAASPAPQPPRRREAARALLRGYLRGGGDLATVREALDPRYAKAFGRFVDHGAIEEIRSELEAVSASSSPVGPRAR